MNILSIDLDFLTENLSKKENDFEIIEPLKFNIINNLIKNKNKNIVFLKTHGEIVNYIKEPVYIYNFDHHHDVFYENEIKNAIYFSYGKDVYNELFEMVIKNTDSLSKEQEEWINNNYFALSEKQQEIVKGF